MQNNIIDTVKTSKLNITLLLVAFLMGICVSFYFVHNYYDKKLDEANAKLTSYEARYSTAIEEREKAIIAKAVADEKANTPVVIHTKGENTNTIEYVEKTSPKDPDLQVTTDSEMKFEYNGTLYDVPTKKVNGAVLKDGKWVMTQQTTSTMNVDDIVNRQIANTVLKKEHEIAVLERQKVQNTIWGTVIGVGIGKLLK